MNSGAFGEGFPYSNFHDLNMDWIIKIAKDFLDQYTNIQQTITEGLEGLDSKAQELEDLLQQWYDTHSEDIANQLADALNDLNNWYTTHEGYLDQYVENSIASFNQQAEQKTEEVLESIPADYTALGNMVTNLKNWLSDICNINIYTGIGADYGHTINESGSIVTTTTGMCTAPLSVLPNKSYAIEYDYENSPGEFGTRVHGYNDDTHVSQLLLVLSSGNNGHTYATFETPENVNNIRVSFYRIAPISNIRISLRTDENPYVTAIDRVARSALSIYESNNLLNPENIINGKFYKATLNMDGNRAMMELADNTAYSCAYIDIDPSKTYHITGASYNCYVADSNGYPIGVAIRTSGSIADPTIDLLTVEEQFNNADKQRERFYFSWRTRTYSPQVFMANEGDSLLPFELYRVPTKTLADDYKIKESNIIKNTYIVDIAGNGDFTSFTDCIRYLKDNEEEKTIYIMPGTYDIFNEIGGATYCASITGQGHTWSEVNDIVPPNTKIIGLGEVIFSFQPESEDIPSDVATLLSPVNIAYSIYMENITIISKNCRYGIHDQSNIVNDPKPRTTHIYKNVKITHSYTDRGMTPAFGCGFNYGQYFHFINCLFTSYDRPFSFHNGARNSNDIDNTLIVIENCLAKQTASRRALRLGNTQGVQTKVEVRVINSLLIGSIRIQDETATQRPNAFALTLLKSGTPTIEITSTVNIYTPKIFN